MSTATLPAARAQIEESTPPVSQPRANHGALVLRLVIGLVFVMHGGQKLFVYGIPGVTGAMEQMGLPAPYLSAVLATATEFLGGLALILGVGTRLAALGLAFTMLVATVAVHLKGGFFLPGGFEYTLTLLFANVAILIQGPGSLALGTWLRARKKTH